MVWLAALIAAGALAPGAWPGVRSCDQEARLVGAVHGTVERADGAGAVAYARIVALPRRGSTLPRVAAKADERGAFSICLPAAAFPVLIWAESGHLVSAPVRVGTEAEAPVRLHLTAGGYAFIGGRVVDAQSGRGLREVDVQLGEHAGTRTDTRGYFSFEAVPPGAFTLVARRSGLQPVTDTIRVAHDVRLDVSMAMSAGPVELAPVLVVARSRGLEQSGFYERQRTGQGAFLTKAEIERMRGVALPTDLLRNMTGLQRARRPNGRGFRIVGRNHCPYRYYVDGVRIGQGFELDDLEWHWIDAIEVYSGLGQVPARFADADPMRVRSCGAVVVWTRQVAR